jgi:hypothetical protein
MKHHDLLILYELIDRFLQQSHTPTTNQLLFHEQFRKQEDAEG